jgi:hypothetical protein
MTIGSRPLPGHAAFPNFSASPWTFHSYAVVRLSLASWRRRRAACAVPGRPSKWRSNDHLILPCLWPLGAAGGPHRAVLGRPSKWRSNDHLILPQWHCGFARRAGALAPVQAASPARERICRTPQKCLSLSHLWFRKKGPRNIWKACQTARSALP